MPKTFRHEDGERHPYRVHLAKALDRLIVELDVKASWLAHCLGISEALLSDYRSARHAIPAYRTALIDELLGTDALLEAQADIEGFHLVHKSTTDLSVEDLERLFPQLLREEGAANAEIVDALMDHMLGGAGKDRLPRDAVKLRRIWQQVDGRTAAGTKTLRK